MSVAELEVLDFVDVSGQALHEASDLVEKVAADHVKAAALIPERVEALSKTVILTKTGSASKLIDESEKSAAAEQLSTHHGALTVLGNLIRLMGEQKVAFDQKLVMSKQGSAVPSPDGQGGVVGKQASVSPTSGDNFVGRRRGEGEVAESDRSLMKLAGINR